jgi:type IV pilus assembly protein PilW
MYLHTRKTPYGLTLVEILVALSISVVITAAIYQTFHVQQQSYVVQSEAAQMQQNLRAGMHMLTGELRSAGYNPTGDVTAGFVTQFAAPYNLFVINYATDDAIVAFTLDDDGDRMIDANEQIAYRYNSATKALERFDAVALGNQWQPLVINVDAVNFVYVDGNGAVTDDPAEFRFVEVTLLIRSDRPTHGYTNKAVYRNRHGKDLCPTCLGDHYHRRLLTTTVQIRNAGLSSL